VFAPTYLALQSAQRFLRPRVANACAVALRLAGYEGVEVEVEWPNPLDRLDEQRVIQGDRDAVDGGDDDTGEAPDTEMGVGGGDDDSA